MSNTVALLFGALLVIALIYDQTNNDGAALIFTGRKLVDLIAWLAFWR